MKCWLENFACKLCQDCTDSDKVILTVRPHCHCDARAVSIILHANYARIAQILK